MHARSSLDDHTIFEENQCRNTSYCKLLRNIWLIINIVLHNMSLISDLFCEIFKNWSHHLAWATPWSPEIYKHKTFWRIASEICISWSKNRHKKYERGIKFLRENRRDRAISIFLFSHHGLEDCFVVRAQPFWIEEIRGFVTPPEWYMFDMALLFHNFDFMPSL